MRGLWLIPALATAGSALVALAQPDLGVELAVPAADSVDAGLFAPEPYRNALHALHRDEPGMEGLGEAECRREAALLFREAQGVARGESSAVVRNARQRFAAVRALAAGARADRDGGAAYRAAIDLAARAESVVPSLEASRALWDEGIDSLVAAMGAAEKKSVAALGRLPEVPYAAYDACPYEGCCYRIWFALRELVARAEPDSASATAFEIHAGEGVLGITGILITTRFGRCMLDPKPEAAREGRMPEPVVLLGYEGEGYFRAYDRGRLAFVECDWDQEVVEPEFVWWAMVQNRDGLVGWVVGALREEQLFYNQDAIEFAPYLGAQGCQ
jgi:hypothetical protein